LLVTVPLHHTLAGACCLKNLSLCGEAPRSFQLSELLGLYKAHQRRQWWHRQRNTGRVLDLSLFVLVDVLHIDCEGFVHGSREVRQVRCVHCPLLQALLHHMLSADEQVTSQCLALKHSYDPKSQHSKMNCLLWSTTQSCCAREKPSQKCAHTTTHGVSSLPSSEACSLHLKGSAACCPQKICTRAVSEDILRECGQQLGTGCIQLYIQIPEDTRGYVTPTMHRGSMGESSVEQKKQVHGAQRT
jgi:hypothetical protein